jgi:hypothetical protein
MNCKSCGNTFDGKYCNECGERVIDPKDRYLRHFFSELLNAFTFADNKFWRTVRILIVQPGQLSLDYSIGIRQKYMKPVSLFFLANFVYFLFPIFEIFTTSLHAQTHFFPYSDFALEWVQSAVAKRGISLEAFSLLYDEKTAELSKLLLVLIVFIMSLFIQMIHVRSKKPFADHLLFSFEFFTFCILYCVNLFSFLLVVVDLAIQQFGQEWTLLTANENVLILPVVVTMFSYFLLRAERNFYSATWMASIAKTILLIVAFNYSLVAYRILLFVVTMWLV